MAQDAKKELDAFHYNWIIENFSMCRQQNSECLLSPAISFGMMSDIQFVLRLYPRGNEVENAMSCFLERIDDKDYEITLAFNVKLFENGSTESVQMPEETRTFDKNNKTWAAKQLLSFEETVKNSLINDSLTIKCYVWLIESKPFQNFEHFILKSMDPQDISRNCLDKSSFPKQLQVYDSIKNIKKKFCSIPYLVIAHTKIPVERNIFKWTITEFSSSVKTQKLIMPVQFGLKYEPDLFLVMKFENQTEDEIANLQIQKMKQVIEQPFALKCRITLLGNKNGTNIIEENIHYFRHEEEIWDFSLIIKKNILMEDRNIYLPNDVLTLECEFMLSCGAIKSVISERRYKTIEYQNLFLINDICSRNLKNDFCQLYEEKSLCDVTLKINKRSFTAHKIVLVARSDVFKAMFETSMKEKHTNTIDIKDMEEDILEAMLKFMYTDSLEKLEMKTATKLYSAAEKYQIPNLKKKCFDFIKRNLNTSNFYEALILTDLYDDQELKTAVLDLLLVHKNKILCSPEWLQFMKSWPRITRSTLYELCKLLPEV